MPVIHNRTFLSLQSCIPIDRPLQMVLPNAQGKYIFNSGNIISIYQVIHSLCRQVHFLPKNVLGNHEKNIFVEALKWLLYFFKVSGHRVQIFCIEKDSLMDAI